MDGAGETETRFVNQVRGDDPLPLRSDPLIPIGCVLPEYGKSNGHLAIPLNQGIAEEEGVGIGKLMIQLNHVIVFIGWEIAREDEVSRPIRPGD